MNILDTNTSYLYAWIDEDLGKFNIGSKTPDGISKESYITSLEDSVWWERYSWGKQKRHILAIGSAESIKALEWFALDYGIKTHKNKFYNKKNNAHIGNQSSLSVAMKTTVVDFIEGRGKGLSITNTDATNNELIRRIAHNIEARSIYKEHLFDTVIVDSWDRNQIREIQLVESAVNKICSRFNENPLEARKTFTPIVVVVLEDGSYLIIDGNTRLAAALRAKGWIEVPVVFINYTEFGETAEERKENYDDFGSYANRESFEVKTKNSDGDLNRRINNIVVTNNLDLTKELDIDRARELVFNKLQLYVPSKQKINGLFKSFMNDFNRKQAELSYQKNLISYSDEFFTTYCWDKYNSKGIATVHIRVPETANAKGIGYICRVMKRTNATRGAIVLYYTSKKEIYDEEENNWIEDLKDTISYNKLPIEVDVLPTFN